jgi:hypothetical protein
MPQGTSRVWNALKPLVRFAFGLLIGLSPAGGAVAPANAGSQATTPPVYLQWLRVAVRHPRIVFLGGTFRCVRRFVGRPCPLWVLRSQDGGLHWTDLRAPIDHALPAPPDPTFSDPEISYVLSPVVIASDGRHVYLDTSSGASGATTFTEVLWSGDGGLHWHQARLNPASYGSYCGSGGYGSGFYNVALSPVSQRRLYAIFNTGGGQSCGVIYSDDAGQTFIIAGDPSHLSTCDCRPWGALVPDPVRPNTVYAHVINYVTLTQVAFVARSDDAGYHWTVVMTPTVAPPLRTFSVSFDPHLQPFLVGRTQDRGVPPDRRYLSADEGRTWRAARCPGDLKGSCPAFTVVNVFGASASYGFVHNGIYRFRDGGPAGARLPISDRLPFRTANLLDVGAGNLAGDPIYALARETQGGEHGLLYRSTDGGRTWQRLLNAAFPISAPPIGQ